MNNFITVNNLTKKYNATIALNNISFNIKYGEVVGLIGANGAGKTTTLNILAGLEPATSGTIYVNNKSILNNDIKKQLPIGTLLDPIYFPKNFRVFEYLHFYAQLKLLTKHNSRIESERIMKLFNIPLKEKHQKIDNLSRGMQQKLAIASSFIGNPKLILLDEPTTNLDWQEHLHFRKLINSLKRKTTFLISSHILSELENICDTFIILQKGNLITTGTLEQLKEKFWKTVLIECTINTTLQSIEHFKTHHQDVSLVFINKTEDNIFIIKIETTKQHYASTLKIIINYSLWTIISLSSNNYNLEGVVIQSTAKSRNHKCNLIPV